MVPTSKAGAYSECTHSKGRLPCLTLIREYLRGRYHCTVDLLFDWFGLACFANKNKNCELSYSCFQPVKQEVNGTVILPPLVFRALIFGYLKKGLPETNALAYFAIAPVTKGKSFPTLT